MPSESFGEIAANMAIGRAVIFGQNAMIFAAQEMVSAPGLVKLGGFVLEQMVTAV